MSPATRLLIVAANAAEAAPIVSALEGAQALPATLPWEVVTPASPALAEPDTPEHVRLIAALEEQQTHLRALSGRLAELEENTRRRLSNELHDRVGQSVTALSLNLNLLRTRLAPGQPELLARIDRCQSLVDDVAQQVRDVLVELRPPVLDDHGLLPALRWYGARWAEETGLSVQTGGQEFAERLPLIVETALFRISQEALNNILRHAAATAVTLTLEQLPDAARLTIADDGQGFSPQRPRGLEERPRWGLITMRERAETVGATMRIDSAPGRGTRIILDVVR